MVRIIKVSVLALKLLKALRDPAATIVLIDDLFLYLGSMTTVWVLAELVGFNWLANNGIFDIVFPERGALWFLLVRRGGFLAG